MSHPTYVILLFPQVKWYVLIWYKYLIPLTCLKTMFRMLQGFHIITYALHIYYLNLFIAFLTPKVEPMTYDDEDDEDAGSLPTSNQSEFKPFIRRLPEFKVTIYHFFGKIIIKIVLVVGNTCHNCCIYMYFLWTFQCTSILANFGHVFYYALHYYDEKTAQTYDQT